MNEIVSDRFCVYHSRDTRKNGRTVSHDINHRAQSGQLHLCTGWICPADVSIAYQRVHSLTLTGAEFQGRADFSGLIVERVADFRDVIFHGRAEFPQAHFLGPVFFNDATFEEVASFTGAVFEGSASFVRSQFRRDAIFAGSVQFESGALFQNTAFLEGSVFADARFGAPTTFYECRFGKLESPEVTGGNFDRTDLRNVVFRRCDMSDALLGQAFAIDQADYDDVRWGTFIVIAGTLPRRRTIAGIVLEEREAREAGDPGKFVAAGRVYRGIRRSLEDHKNFAAANSFADRELEMRRLGKFADGQLPVLEAVYLWLSGYGAAPGRPLLWLGLLLASFPYVFAWAGIETTAGKYRLVAASEVSALAGYSELLAFTIRTAAFLPETPGTILPLPAQLVAVLLRLLAPFLALLFTLAIRRQFRR